MHHLAVKSDDRNKGIGNTLVQECLKKLSKEGIQKCNILESEEGVIGCAALEKADSELCYLERLAVLPEKRNRGLGRILMDHIFEEAKSTGCKKISIGIIAKHVELKKWYNRIGFTEGETKKFEHLPFQVLYMEYNLT